jgi:hypothetical protein
MEKTRPDIKEKIGAIQVGLLRYTHKGKKQSFPVRIAVEQKDSLNCVLSNDVPSQKLLNKNVTLIQKDHDNYMYIDGRISREVQNHSLVVSVNITKACWFIRKSRGSVTWLQEKCIYMPPINLAS